LTPLVDSLRARPRPDVLSLRSAASEALGTALLLAAVVGSGIMGERLAGGNVALALLANSIATGAALYALIVTFGPISGAEFNPVVTVALAMSGLAPRHRVFAHLVAQVIGAILGVWLAHAMFDLPILQTSVKVRSGTGQWIAEGVATFGLVLMILLGAARKSAVLPAVVACYITAAYWFTASTSFANPAVTIARALTNTFAGIAPSSAPGFIAAQVAGAMLATVVARCWRENPGGD
jgi:glycerol uptake facilitator-like aquaporin